MKRLALAFCVLATFALSACTTFLEPTCSENDDILVDVYNKTCESYLGEDWYFVKQLFTEDIPDGEKISRVQMLEWNLNESMQGGSYTGYYVTYEVQIDKKRWYALVDLTEFDSGRYEWKVIEASESLSEIQGMLY